MYPMLNRSAIVLRPKRPFLEWAATADPDHPTDPAEVAEAFARPTLHLIPEYEDDEHAAEVLDAWAETLFEEMLEGWIDDPSRWPETRDRATLQEWFDIELFDMVVDTDTVPLEYEEILEEEDLPGLN